MRKLFLFIAGLFTLAVNAQAPFQTISFAEALQRAEEEGKLIFLQFESATCKHCNEVADKAFSDKGLADQLQQSFVALKITSGHPDRAAIAALYNKGEGFATLFVNRQKTLIHQYAQTTTLPGEYQNQMDIALQKESESLKVSELEREYRAGNRSLGFIETLLIRKKMLRLATDDLLDEYAALLPFDSLTAVRTLTFIAAMAPVLGSRADTVLRRDGAAFTRAWYSIPQATRVTLNNMIIHESLLKAVQQKDEAFARRTAVFAQSTYDRNYAAGERAYKGNMLQYYEQTGDTAQYFPQAIAYYSRYFMTVNADSVKKIDSLNRLRQLTSARKDTVVIDGKKTIRATTTYRSIAQSYTWQLSNAALLFYQKTANPHLLSIATEWAGRALSFYESPEALDIYARLLYRSGQKEKGIETMAKAIALRRERNFNTKEYQGILEKMKRNAPIN